MKIYLAAHDSRRTEICAYRTQLEALGHTIIARWLNGPQDVEETRPSSMRHDATTHVTHDDRDDVTRAECLILFTDPPGSAPTRGGAMAEFVLGWNRALRCMENLFDCRLRPWRKIILLCGPEPSGFGTRPDLHHFLTWEACVAWLIATEETYTYA